MADNPLWLPSQESIQKANITLFMEKLRKDYGVTLTCYEDLYTFSIKRPQDFWEAVWSFCGVISKTQGDRVTLNTDTMEHAKFFPDAKLNYAENILRRRDNAVAITFYGEDKVLRKLTFLEIYQQVIKIANKFKEWGVQPGDRVAGYLPNMPETIIAMLAASAIGAIWSSCSPDFGIQGIVDRFAQISPKVILMADGYYYGGKSFSYLNRLLPIRAQIPSIEHVIVVPYLSEALDISTHELGGSIEFWGDLMISTPDPQFDFIKLPFQHPLFILYSSGTTGMPKCIVHSAGGALLQHLKEHQLHCDIKPNDQVFYYTTCGWMMWNWLVSALGSGASIVLYDGSPFYPHPEILFDIADKENFTFFGTSAKYISSLAKLECNPIEKHPLSSLRMMASTGSPLTPQSFHYVYNSIKKDICLASISGGTDIISCFVLGNPIGPVWPGEAQTRGLGLAVEVFDEEGRSIIGKKGELVCTQPFPSQPLEFWNDPQGQKYHEAYFSRFPNVWHHGDFVELTNHGGMIIYGRSDTLLNPGGVRIGTAEIYRQVEQIPEVTECVAVGQQWGSDERIILFVLLKEGEVLNEQLCQRIKSDIRTNTTPRHVPAKILSVTDIPRTKNGKIAERAVRDAIHNEPINNKESLANPDVLHQFENRKELLEE